MPQERTQLMLELSSEGFWDWDVMLSSGYLSPRCREILGFGPDEAPWPESLERVIHPGDLPRVKATIEGLFSGRLKKTGFECRLSVPGRSEAWVSVWGTVVEEDGQGFPARLAGTILDITKQYQTEEALRACDDRFHCLLETTSQLAVQGYSLDGTVTFWNKTSELIYGYSRSEALGRNLLDLIIPPEMHQDVRNAINTMAQTGEAIPASELSLLRKDGSRVPVYSSHALISPPGRPIEFFCIDMDLTPLLEAEETVKRVESKYKRLFESMTDAYASVDLAGKIQEFNTAFQKLIGYPAEEIPFLTNQDLTPEASRIAEEAVIQTQVLVRGYSDLYEKQYRRKDGTLITVELKTFLLKNDNGSPAGMWAIIRDISRRKELELELKTKDERFTSIMTLSPDIISIMGADGELLYNSPAAERIHGYTVEEMIGRNTLELIHPDDRETVGMAMARLLAQPGAYDTVQYRYRNKNGSYTWMEAVAHNQIDNPLLQGIIVISRDISKRRQAEDDLKASEERYHRFTSITSDYVYCCSRTTDSPYRIKWLAGAVEQITGFSQSEIEQMGCWLKVVHPDDLERIRDFLESLSVGSRGVVKFRILTKAGTERWIQESCSCEAGALPGELELYGTAQDITERELLHDQLLKNQKLESLGVLAGGIAHDFNNIITGIMGNISFAQIFLDAGHKSYKPLMQAEKASMRAAELAHQLLTFARGGEPVKRLISIEQLVHESVSLVLRGSNVRGNICIPEPLHAVEADEGQVSQTFNNIIINATHSMPGGGELTISASNVTLGRSNPQALSPGPYVRITFVDEGCGIPPENLKRIFDPYYSTKASGTGLGLASAYSIISKHGGCIDATSLVGKGTTFTLYLPSTGSVYQGKESASQQTYDMKSGAHILVMDDEELIRNLAADMLTHLGYQVKTCADGAEAISLYRAARESGEPYSAVIMDLTVPGGMGGAEAAKGILEIDPQARLIVSSGYSNDAIMSEYQSHGFCAAVAKPYKVEDVGQLLGAALSSAG